MMLRPFRAEIVVAAGARGLDPDLVQAVVERESAYDPAAWNPEPRYRWLWDVRADRPFRAIGASEAAYKFPPADFRAPLGVEPDAEWWGQQASWGLMQIMGANAREHGFRGKFLTELVRDPILNLNLGCAYLAQQMAWAGRQYKGTQAGSVTVIRRKALAAYNAGTAGSTSEAGQAYALAVLPIWERIRTEAHA